MKKTIILLLVSLLPFSALANETLGQGLSNIERQAVIEVIALNQDQIEQLNLVRAKYQTLKSELDDEYQQIVHSIFMNAGEES